VRRFDQANLITPLQGVERAVFVTDSAGGADPENEDRTLRFAPVILSQRETIITLADLEAEALRSAPDAAQVSAHQKAGGVELIVVWRGSDPRPSAAQLRALTTHLQSRVAPGLAVEGALDVRKPDILAVRAELTIRIDHLSSVSGVKDECVRRLRALLDPATGGLDRRGWPLGAVPSIVDLSAQLDGIEHLEELVSAKLLPANAKDGGTLAPTYRQLLQIVPDGVKIDAQATDQEEAA
jgi:hypothetical protein